MLESFLNQIRGEVMQVPVSDLWVTIAGYFLKDNLCSSAEIYLTVNAENTQEHERVLMHASSNEEAVEETGGSLDSLGLSTKTTAANKKIELRLEFDGELRGLVCVHTLETNSSKLTEIADAVADALFHRRFTTGQRIDREIRDRLRESTSIDLRDRVQIVLRSFLEVLKASSGFIAVQSTGEWLRVVAAEYQSLDTEIRPSRIFSKDGLFGEVRERKKVFIAIDLQNLELRQEMEDNARKVYDSKLASAYVTFLRQQREVVVFPLVLGCQFLGVCALFWDDTEQRRKGELNVGMVHVIEHCLDTLAGETAMLMMAQGDDSLTAKFVVETHGKEDLGPTSNRSTREILEDFAQRAWEISTSIGADKPYRCGIYVLSSDNESLEAIVRLGEWGDVSRYKIDIAKDLESSAVLRAFDSAQPYLIYDTLESGVHYLSPVADEANGTTTADPVRSCVTVPTMSRGHVYAILYMDWQNTCGCSNRLVRELELLANKTGNLLRQHSKKARLPSTDVNLPPIESVLEPDLQEWLKLLSNLTSANAEGASLFLWDRDLGLNRLRASKVFPELRHNKSARYVGNLKQFDQPGGLDYRLLTESQEIIQEQSKSLTVSELNDDQSIGSMLILPVRIGDKPGSKKTIGVLRLVSGTHRFSNIHRQLAEQGIDSLQDWYVRRDEWLKKKALADLVRNLGSISLAADVWKHVHIVLNAGVGTCFVDVRLMDKRPTDSRLLLVSSSREPLMSPRQLLIDEGIEGDMWRAYEERMDFMPQATSRSSEADESDDGHNDPMKMSSYCCEGLFWSNRQLAGTLLVRRTNGELRESDRQFVRDVASTVGTALDRLSQIETYSLRTQIKGHITKFMKDVYENKDVDETGIEGLTAEFIQNTLQNLVESLGGERGWIRYSDSDSQKMKARYAYTQSGLPHLTPTEIPDLPIEQFNELAQERVRTPFYNELNKPLIEHWKHLLRFLEGRLIGVLTHKDGLGSMVSLTVIGPKNAHGYLTYNRLLECCDRLEEVIEICEVARTIARARSWVSFFHVVVTLGQQIHDLRGPLNGLYFHLDKLHPANTKEQSQVEKIRHHYNNLKNIVDRFGEYLRFNQITSLDLLPGRLGTLVSAVEAFASEENLAGLVTVHVQSRAPESLRIRMLKDELVRAILNVIRNACHAATEANGKHGRVDILFDYCPSSSSITIDVRDNGKGISPALKDTLYDIFKPSRNGYGLGLAMARHMISEVHRGNLKHAETDHPGTLFQIKLPVLGSKHQNSEAIQ